MKLLRCRNTLLLCAVLMLSAVATAQGRACDRVQQTSPSASAFNEMKSRAEDSGLLDVESADQFVRMVFRSADASLYETAADIFTRVLIEGETASSESDQLIVQCHRAQLRLIAPKDLGEGGPSASEYPMPLLAWIRSQDPRPSTAVNERVVEHLHRVSIAVSEYEDSRSTSGVDARGEVYIRLGEPFRVTTVQFNDSQVLQVIRESPILTRSDFPANQYWVYPSLSEYATYLFFKDGSTWKIGEVQDLIPSFYRSGMGNNQRGFERSRNLAILLQEVYSQLSTIDLDYATLYHEAENVAAPTLTGGSRMSRIRRLVSRGRRYDRDRAFRREESVPQQHTTRPRTETSFPVNIRTARFLNESGATRTDVYWGLTPETIAGAPKSALRFSVVQYASGYQKDTVYVRQYEIPARDSSNAFAVVAPTLTSEPIDAADLYHLAFQWDWYQPSTDSDRESMASFTTVKRADTISTLTADPRRLEMSDLLATFVPSSPATVSRDDLRPYPFSYISQTDGFGLYFEVYNLVFDATDATRYTVSYTFRKWGDDGRWISFSADESQATTTEAVYSGSTRRSKEFIVIDPDQLRELKNVERLQVVVQVTDEESGQRVERQIEFEYDESPIQ